MSVTVRPSRQKYRRSDGPYCRVCSLFPCSWDVKIPGAQHTVLDAHILDEEPGGRRGAECPHMSSKYTSLMGPAALAGVATAVCSETVVTAVLTSSAAGAVLACQCAEWYCKCAA
jgi:hypothetical protein